MILLDSYGWIKYFAAGELVDKYATAKTERAKLVPSDEHFKGFEGVEFIEE